MAIKATARLLIAFLLGGFIAQITLAQPEAITQPPPAITFEGMHELDSNEDSTIYDMRFPSALETPYPENNEVPVRVCIPKWGKAPFPAVVVLHYWGATDLRLESSLASDLNRRGIAALIVTLPYHVQRTPKGFKSGDLAIQPDPARLRANMLQSVLDVRRTIDWAQTRPEFRHDKFGIAGTSLGSIVAELAFGIEPRIEFACFSLGGVDLAHIIWNSTRVVFAREGMRKQGLNEAKLRDELRPVEPLSYLPSRTSGTSFVIGARHDTVIPVADTKKLVDSLKDPAVLWLNTGHYGGALVERQILRAIAAYFSKSFAGETYAAPNKLYAPTIRLGFQTNGGTGFQVAAGIDLWRSNKEGDGFAAALVTPRGLQGYIGYRINGGLSVGITVLHRRTTWGVMWSVVL